MIIVRCPLRITLGGGGTDLPSYYREHGGFLIAAAIDKYVYITVHQTFVDDLIVKYSKLERVATVDDLKHPIVREAFKLVELEAHSLEITSMADIPAGTGLGSSGSFTTALLKALHSHRKMLIHPRELAEQACDIEINRLRRADRQAGPIHRGVRRHDLLPFQQGRQRRGLAAQGRCPETLYNLEDNLLLFFTGYSRSASSILKEQDDKTKQQNADMIQNLHYVKDLGLRSLEGAGKRPPHRVRAADGRALAAQEAALRRHVQPEDQRVVRPRDGQRRGGRQADRRGRRRLPDVLRRGQDAAAPRHEQAGLKEVRFRFDFEGTKSIV